MFMDKKARQRQRMDDVIDNATKRAELEELRHELAEIKVEHEDVRNQLKRAVADYHNLVKRVEESRSELSSYVGMELVMKLLPTLDHLEQALSGVSEEEKQSGWVKGVELAVKEFKNVLQSEGLEEIVTEGQFDPSLHEAVDVRNGDDNMILEVTKKGFMVNGKVVRPAQVVVGRKE